MKHALLPIILASGAIASPISVNVTGVRQDPTTQKVIVTYDLANENNDPALVRLSVYTNGVDIGAENVKTFDEGSAVSAAIDSFVAPGENLTLTWNARKDWAGNLSSNATIAVTAYYTNMLWDVSGVYMVVDLADANFPVAYSFDGPDLSESTYSYAKTKLWLKRCEPGQFWMGSPEDEPGRTAANEYRHFVTLTKPFFFGISPVTFGQYEAVTGVYSPVNTIKNNAVDDVRTLPVTDVSYVNATNLFCKALEEKNGWKFGLPSDAQWEYACRAGCEAALYNGGTSLAGNVENPALDPIAWYRFNANKTMHRVCTKQPNAWGIYDTLGQCYEIMADDFVADLRNYTLDPLITDRGGACAIRGIGIDTNTGGSQRYYRCGYRKEWTRDAHWQVSFRVAITLD